MILSYQQRQNNAWSVRLWVGCIRVSTAADGGQEFLFVAQRLEQTGCRTEVKALKFCALRYLFWLCMMSFLCSAKSVDRPANFSQVLRTPPS